MIIKYFFPSVSLKVSILVGSMYQITVFNQLKYSIADQAKVNRHLRRFPPFFSFTLILKSEIPAGRIIYFEISFHDFISAAVRSCP